ncbi:MAG: translocation/assembly module TamB domain-containing protein, partial [Gemmatimonadetes bacterium]|nr:translocation/assembly module TamB domain-containing protein [Gemmatimonadota bacterium]
VRLDGGGRVPLTPAAGTDTADFQAHVALESLTPVEESLGLEALTAGDGSLDVRVQGDVDSLRVTGVAHVGALAFGSTRLVGLDLESMARWSPDRGWRSAGGELVLDRLSLPTTGVTETRLTADWSAGEDLVVGARARIDQRRTAELEARLDPAAEQPALTVEQASFQVDESRWTLPQPAQIRYGNGIAVEGLELATDGGAQRIALDLSLGGEAPLRVRADVEALRVETIADLAGFDRLQGELDLRMDLEGSGEAARGDADITFDVESEEGGGGTLRATATFQDGRVLVDGEIEQQDRTALQLAGSVPVPGADAGTLDLQIQADSFGVDFATPFLDPATVRSLDGAVDGRVDIQGTLDDPSLDGALTASDVYAHIVPLGLRYGLEGRVSLGGSAVQVPDLRITSGEGAMVLSGVIDVERGSIGRYDLDVRMDDFRAIRTDLVHAEVSGDLAIQGTVPEPVIGGSVTIERGDLYLGGAVASGDVEDVVLTDEDYAALEEYFGFPIQRLEESEAPGFEAVALDLSVQVGRDSWLRQSANPELAVQVAGEMTIRKDPGPDLELLGELEAIPQRSYVEQFGRRFDLRQGQLVFRGDPLATRLDLQAVYEVPSRTDDEPEATIVLGMEGEVGDLRIVLSAEPTMDNADIVSYIATGRPASSSLDLGGGNGGGESVLERGGGLALDRVGGLIESFAADRVGLDVVEIRREGLEAATLVAGRYVSPSLYLGFQQPVSLDASSDQGGNAETQVEIEYQAFRWLLLNLQSGGDALQFFLRTRYGY